MERFVKNLCAVKYLMLAAFLLVLSTNFSYANSNESSKRTYKEIYAVLMRGGVDNLRVGLESANDGLRMASVDKVGIYKVFQLEDEVIDLLDKEESVTNRKNIAVTLYQLGTYKSLIKLEELAKADDEKELTNFCRWLLKEHNRVDENNLADAIKIEKAWAVDLNRLQMNREEK